MSQPTTPAQYLTIADLPIYAPSATLDPTQAEALIQKASAAINARYDRTAEIVQIVDEIVELNELNIGHLSTTPIQVTAASGVGLAYMDPTQGDYILARYARGLYPYATYSPPAWESLDLTTCDVMPNSGKVMLPVGYFPIPYAEAKITYRAGFCPVGGPYPEWLKQGTGRLIENWFHRSGTTKVKDLQVADQQHVIFFDASLFDESVEQFLTPMRKRMWY